MSRRLVASSLAAALLALVPNALPRSADAATTPGLRWAKCADVRTHQCARLSVPLDRNNPAAGSTTIAVERRRASVPSARVGAIFVNPGGPGEAATAKVDDFARMLGRKVTDRFDIVAVDPRGVGRSSRVSCTTRPGTTTPPSLEPGFPVTVAQARAQISHDDAVRAACRRTGGPLLQHMTTADDARDMDQVRALMGDRQLTFVGFSYGTVLGQTYAAMYPSRVRAMVLDGVLDPVQWTAGSRSRYVPVGARLHTGDGAWAAVRQAYAQCQRAGKAKCASAARGIAEWNTVWSLLVKSPRTVWGSRFTWADLVTSTLYSLYDPGTVPGALDDVHNLYLALTGKQVSPAAAAATVDRQASATRQGFGLPGEVLDVTRQAVMCSDSLDPYDRWATWRAAAATRDRTRGFDAAGAWSSSLCTSWPGAGKGAYRGPFNRRPATPILFMNALYDPATSIVGARSAHAMSPGSRLVTGNKVGHLLLNDSACATRIRTNYLLTKALPAQDVACTDVRPLY